MPETFPPPEIQGRPKKSERDITEGEITKDGRTVSWKSSEPINKEAELFESSLKKLKQTGEESKADGFQKSDNVIKMGEGNLFRSQKYDRRRQEKITELERLNRGTKNVLKSKGEALWNSVFEGRDN